MAPVSDDTQSYLTSHVLNRHASELINNLPNAFDVGLICTALQPEEKERECGHPFPPKR